MKHGPTSLLEILRDHKTRSGFGGTIQVDRGDNIRLLYPGCLNRMRADAGCKFDDIDTGSVLNVDIGGLHASAYSSPTSKLNASPSNLPSPMR
jgi:hypothetical protein